VHDAHRAHEVLLVVDQFEELFFNPARSRERLEFLTELREAVAELPMLRVLCAMRSDYLADLVALESQIRSRLFVRFMLESLDEPTARQVIMEAFRTTGDPLTPDDVDHVLQGLLAIEVGPGGPTVKGTHVNLIQLQIYCRRLWERRRSGERENAESLDDLATSMRLFVDDAVSSVASSNFTDEGVLRRWLRSNLVMGQGQRAIVPFGEDAAGLPLSTVRALEKKRLIQVEQRNRGRWIELTHDSLVEALQQSNQRWEHRHRIRRTRRVYLGFLLLALLVVLYLVLRQPQVVEDQVFSTGVVEAGDTGQVELGEHPDPGVLVANVSINPFQSQNSGVGTATVRLIEIDQRGHREVVAEHEFKGQDILLADETTPGVEYTVEVEADGMGLDYSIQADVIEPFNEDAMGGPSRITIGADAGVLKAKGNGFVMIRGGAEFLTVPGGGEILSQTADDALVRVGPAGYVLLQHYGSDPITAEVERAAAVRPLQPNETRVVPVRGTTVVPVAALRDSEPFVLDVTCGSGARSGLGQVAAATERSRDVLFPAATGDPDAVHTLVVGRVPADELYVLLTAEPSTDSSCEVSLQPPSVDVRREPGELQVELTNDNLATTVPLNLDRAAILVANQDRSAALTRVQCARGATLESPPGERLLAYVPAGVRCVFVAAYPLDEVALTHSGRVDQVIDLALLPAPNRLTARNER
jgi:hypothetical protein